MPLALADPSLGEDIASRSIATGVPTDFEENFAASWRASRLNDRFIGEGTAVAEEYDRFIEQTFKATGQRFPNPARNELPPGINPIDLTGDPRIPVPVEMATRLFEDYARKAGATPPTVDEMRNAAHARMFDLEQTRGDVGSRAAGASASFGQFAGSAAAVMTDPPILLSMLFGGGEAASVIAAMGREALVAGASEALVQPQIQSGRLRAGLPGGVGPGLASVGMAALGAGALTGAFRGGAAAYRALSGDARKILEATGDAATADSARYTERYADLQGRNPLAETAGGATEHVERVSAAQRRLYEPDAGARLRDEPNNPVRSDIERETVRPVFEPETPAAAALALGERLAADARKSAEALDTFKTMRSIARDLSLGGTDDEALALARGAAPREPADDPSLVQFVISKGGINDNDRALSSIGVTPRNRPGLVRRDGISASQMSELAAEAGYFPPSFNGEGSRTIDQRELATAIKDELEGQKLFARHGDTGNIDARANFDALSQMRADVNRSLAELGLDTRKLSNDEIRESVRRLAETPEPAPDLRADFEAEAIETAKRTESDLDFAAEREERLAIAAENEARSQFASRMDEPVYVEVNGEIRAVPAREIFQGLDDDARLVDEFAKCISEVPF